MSILVTGKGGREHAILTTLARPPSSPKLYVWPGSAAMEEVAERVSVPSMESLVEWMQRNAIDLCVVGEEQYLAAGLADRCRAAGIPAWGPGQCAARLESSKLFAKDFLLRHGIPTGWVREAGSAEALRAAVEGYPAVLKFDGLAAGKGVAVCLGEQEVEDFVDRAMVKQAFGPGRVFVEEYLEGPEVSVICALSDDGYQIFPAARDYKRQLDGDRGPNTGGMGAVASVSLLDAGLREVIESDLLPATMNAINSDGLDYRGFLYFGLILTSEGPKVLEFNCRFGDPEAQAVLPLVRGDFAAYLLAAAGGHIDHDLLSFADGWSVAVVMASKDYPGRSSRGEAIVGLDEVVGAQVFHSGTNRDGSDGFIVDGGRVLSVVGQGSAREKARDRAFRALAAVKFDGAQYRTDIGTLHFEE